MSGTHPRPKVDETTKEPYMSRTITSLLFVLAAALTAASIASASSATGATLVIRHQTRGCHSWSLNGGPFNPRQTLSLARGASLTIKNTDVMPHTLIEARGPAALLQHAAMNRMGAVATVTFRATGTYVFTTKTGADYMPGVKTVGPDNILSLVVHVR